MLTLERFMCLQLHLPICRMF